MALIKSVKKETLRKEWRAISLVFAQLIVAILIVFQILRIAGLHINVSLMQVAIKPVWDASDIIVLAMGLILFALLYFAVKRQPKLYKAEGMAPGIIKDEAKQKLRKIKHEPQAPALLLIELMFVAVVVLAIKAYLDPEEELIPWSSVGIGPPITTIVNAIIALLVLGVFYYLYRLTAPYRKR